ncbi:type II secretion system protein GspL [Leucothrix pacifica]|uniref:Type II secretion system protein L n=1 Tax=Leucothrix pacifica TaxID=1247513 RepID=A0A317CP02_9GAMM|nr:type II secretion system protein GspL [Leucothrix pacifica]PWR00237.1 hypothetical protein DKW60_03610 [Leucothrix pacifica]
MQLLIIKITSPDATPLGAVISPKKTEASFTETDWETIRKHQRGNKIVLLVPDTDVSLAQTTIPSKNKKQMMQALPFALEESLAEDVDNLHFSAYRESDDSTVKAAIIKHERLGFWVDFLKSHDINVHYILPSVFALPIEEDGWSVNIGEEEAQIRQSTFDGFVCDLDVMDYILPNELEEHPPEALYVSGDSLRVTRLLQDQDIEIRAGRPPHSIKYADIQPTLVLNLLTNYNRGESALKNIDWSPWKPVAVIGSLLLLTWLGMGFWQNHQSQLKLDAIEAEISKVYRGTIPSGNLTNPDQQLASMTSRLSLLQGGLIDTSVSPLPTIASIAPILKRFPKMIVKELIFKRNRLEIKVETPNLGMIDQFKQTAEKLQLRVEIGSSKTTTDSVASTLFIQEAK